MKTCELCGGYGTANNSCFACSHDPFDEILREAIEAECADDARFCLYLPHCISDDY